MGFVPAWVWAAASVAGTVVQMAGARQAGKDASRMAEYNAAVLERDAQAARQAATFEENLQRGRARSVLAGQRAAFAKAGVTMEGSPLELAQATAEEAELDALAIRYSGSIAEARAKSAAAAERLAGRAARRTAGYQAAGALLTGVTRLGSIYGGGRQFTFDPDAVP